MQFGRVRRNDRLVLGERRPKSLGGLPSQRHSVKEINVRQVKLYRAGRKRRMVLHGNVKGTPNLIVERTRVTMNMEALLARRRNYLNLLYRCQQFQNVLLLGRLCR